MDRCVVCGCDLREVEEAHVCTRDGKMVCCIACGIQHLSQAHNFHARTLVDYWLSFEEMSTDDLGIGRTE
jgi:hypothetical protein